jgi:hypothetical protein
VIKGNAVDKSSLPYEFQRPSEYGATPTDPVGVSAQTTHGGVELLNVLPREPAQASPQKPPKSSFKRFVADLPNECWQADMTHVEVGDGAVYEVLNMIDGTPHPRESHRLHGLETMRPGLPRPWRTTRRLALDNRAIAPVLSNESPWPQTPKRSTETVSVSFMKPRN